MLNLIYSSYKKSSSKLLKKFTIVPCNKLGHIVPNYFLGKSPVNFFAKKITRKNRKDEYQEPIDSLPTHGLASVRLSLTLLSLGLAFFGLASLSLAFLRLGILGLAK